ncbi:hypothetical protein JAAARDRAFT_191240 [Jaapia argillacea MUCL 33604]|uniref:Uncharacterized protein n=1 Tax=Jaapia argillacea MUCL 33604 TaxID=933084 RepID=A0A067Q2D2_9AGAM|nr:hypothetical protein JAAARDRAFT_191240 [Jaapia argillacea MUCL 33604]
MVLDNSELEQLPKLLKIFGDDKLREFRDETLGEDLIATDTAYFSLENAGEWLDFQSFRRWVTTQLQARARPAALSPLNHTPSPSPSHSHRLSTSASPSQLPSTASSVRKRPRVQHGTTTFKPEDILTIDDNPAPSTSSKELFVKKEPTSSPLHHPVDPIEISSDSDEGESVMVVKAGTKRKKQQKQKELVEGLSKLITITRQLKVAALIKFETIPNCWPVPRDNDSVAYHLDMTKDRREWMNSKRQLLSMAAIIKSEDQDAWGGGTAGSTQLSKLTAVDALGTVKCQRADHECQGVFVCDQFDPSLLLDCIRYDPNDAKQDEIWEAERNINVVTSSSMHATAATFYVEARNTPCPHETSSGDGCSGVAVLRKFNDSQVSLDGKHYFIGCSLWKKADGARSHRWVPIPITINEDLVVELFQNNGIFKVEPRDICEVGKCAFVVKPRNARGRKVCPYVHMDTDGHVVQGNLIRRPCPSKITIFSPIDRTNHQAIVIIKGAHNHPKPPSTKVTRTGKDLYRQAAESLDMEGLTVLKCDRALSTARVFEGLNPAAIDPALAISRNKRKVIQKVKLEKAPHGNGMEGVYARKKAMEKLPQEEQYIHEIYSSDGMDLIITMLPNLAAKLHHARCSLHDNTYKRLHGGWKEWEVVIWDDRLNMRLTIARLYCTRETHDAYLRMWSSLWDTIGKVTGNAVKFKFIHGSGLRAILVDGNKRQIEACGEDLLKRTDPILSKLPKNITALEIIPYIIRNCFVHVNRSFDEMAPHLPPDVMKRVRTFPILETQDQLDEFKTFCDTTDHKKLKDWYKDKKGCSWFFGTINRNFSKIVTEDWFTTPFDTNLNESAHPFTNLHTGTNLSLLDAILSAYKLDRSIEEKMWLAETNKILPNHRNTLSHRMHSNRLRQEGRSRQREVRDDNLKQLLELEEKIEQQKVASAQLKELKEQKKALQKATGVKKPKAGRATKGKGRDPEPADDAEPTENVEPHPASQQSIRNPHIPHSSSVPSSQSSSHNPPTSFCNPTFSFANPPWVSKSHSAPYTLPSLSNDTPSSSYAHPSSSGGGVPSSSHTHPDILSSCPIPSSSYANKPSSYTNTPSSYAKASSSYSNPNATSLYANAPSSYANAPSSTDTPSAYANTPSSYAKPSPAYMGTSSSYLNPPSSYLNPPFLYANPPSSLVNPAAAYANSPSSYARASSSYTNSNRPFSYANASPSSSANSSSPYASLTSSYARPSLYPNPSLSCTVSSSTSTALSSIRPRQSNTQHLLPSQPVRETPHYTHLSAPISNPLSRTRLFETSSLSTEFVPNHLQELNSSYPHNHQLH